MKVSRFIYSFFVALFVICCFRASAADTYTFKAVGTVGSYKIHATLVRNGESFTGNYYYDWTRAKGSKSTLRLSGGYVGEYSGSDGRSLTLFEYNSNGRVIGRFELFLDWGGPDNPVMYGTYYNLQNGKSFQVFWELR